MSYLDVFETFDVTIIVEPVSTGTQNLKVFLYPGGPQ